MEGERNEVAYLAEEISKLSIRHVTWSLLIHAYNKIKEEKDELKKEPFTKRNQNLGRFGKLPAYSHCKKLEILFTIFSFVLIF